MRYLARIIVALTFGLPPMAAAQSPPSEYQLKAAFLLNFARYAEWPSLPPGSLKICLYGRDPFGAALSSLEHRQVQGREVKVVLLGSIEQASACQLLFISDSEERRSATLLRSLAGTPVLTVSDMEGFVDEGGGIGFVLVDDRIRFDINNAAIQRGGMKLSAQLLRLARRVLGLEAGK